MTWITKRSTAMLTLYFKCRLYVSIFLQQLRDGMLCFCARQWGRQAGGSPSCQEWLWSWQPRDPAKPALTDGFWVPADLWSLLAWSGTKELVHQGPSHVYLTKAAIAYMLINVFALHVAGGGPRPPHAAVQVSASLPSLYVTQNKSGKPTTRHIKMTRTGKDNFCHWCEKLLSLAMMPMSTIPADPKTCGEFLSLEIWCCSDTEGHQQLKHAVAKMLSATATMEDAVQPFAATFITTYCHHSNEAECRQMTRVCHHSALAWQPSAPVALIQPQYTNRSSAGPKVIICPSTMSSFHWRSH